MNKLGFGFLRLPVTPAGEIDLSLSDDRRIFSPRAELF